MNTSRNTLRIRASVMLLAFSISFFSCSKEIIETNIGAMVDLAVVSTFKYQLGRATTLDDLPAGVKSAAGAISTVLGTEEISLYSQANLDAEASALKSALTLSESEMRGLKANQSAVFDAVLSRMSRVVSFASESDLESHHRALVSNPQFAPFLAGRDNTSGTIYETSDYQAILDLQKVLDAYMVQMMQKVQDLKKSTVRSGDLYAGSAAASYDREVATLVAVILDQSYCILRPYWGKYSDSYKSGK